MQVSGISSFITSWAGWSELIRFSIGWRKHLTLIEVFIHIFSFAISRSKGAGLVRLREDGASLGNPGVWIIFIGIALIWWISAGSAGLVVDRGDLGDINSRIIKGKQGIRTAGINGYKVPIWIFTQGQYFEVLRWFGWWLSCSSAVDHGMAGSFLRPRVRCGTVGSWLLCLPATTNILRLIWNIVMFPNTPFLGCTREWRKLVPFYTVINHFFVLFDLWSSVACLGREFCSVFQVYFNLFP